MYIRSTSTFINFTLRHQDNNASGFVKSGNWRKEINATLTLGLKTGTQHRVQKEIELEALNIEEGVQRRC